MWDGSYQVLGEEEKENFCLMGIQFPLCKMTSSRNLFHSNANILSTIELHLKMVKDESLLHVFTTIKSTGIYEVNLLMIDDCVLIIQFLLA